jgi:cytochrome b subunit of formate dehydrogenase
MKKEFGKWLMDIAKYMVTALLLSTIFADMQEPIIIYMVIILSIVILISGLILISDEDGVSKTVTNKK